MKRPRRTAFEINVEGIARGIVRTLKTDAGNDPDDMIAEWQDRADTILRDIERALQGRFSRTVIRRGIDDIRDRVDAHLEES